MRGPRRRLAAAALVALTGLVTAGPGTTGAGATEPLDRWSSATVSRLTLRGGAGWLTVDIDVRSAGWNGLVVRLPAALDGPEDLTVPGAAIGCRRLLPTAPPNVVEYRCGQTAGTDPPAELPTGRYELTVPVTGHLPATDYQQGGSVGLWDAQDGRLGFEDGFPVTDADADDAGRDSTAEARVARLRWAASPDGSPEVTATVSARVVVAPGEPVTELEILTSDTPWRMTGTNAPSLGLQCFVVHPAISRLIRCRPAPGRTAFPVGAYQLTSRLVSDGYRGAQDPEGDRTLVLLGDSDEDLRFVDNLDWRFE